jgi:hypothetical protein
LTVNETSETAWTSSKRLAKVSTAIMSVMILSLCLHYTIPIQVGVCTAGSKAVVGGQPASSETQRHFAQEKTEKVGQDDDQAGRELPIAQQKQTIKTFN